MKKIIIGLILLLVLGVVAYIYRASIGYVMVTLIQGKRTIAEVVSTHQLATQTYFEPLLHKVGMSYPPKQLALIAFKETKVLELWAANEDGRYQLISTYPILAASGQLGPKLREGDKQVPEGLYKIIGLNPNSTFHLSMKLNYPNEYDLKYAQLEGRDKPGSDIFIHGKAVSVGCLALGGEFIEKLFTLVAQVGMENVQVLIAPHNPQLKALVATANMPSWTNELYVNITAEYLRITQGF